MKRYGGEKEKGMEYEQEERIEESEFPLSWECFETAGLYGLNGEN
jgi:hypothetical protein